MPRIIILSEEEQCNTQNCPVNCTVTPWSQWSNCSKICGGGSQIKSRSVTSPSQYGGVCQELSFLSEEEKCNTQNCPVNCTVTPWSQWSNCSKICGGGSQIKSRSVTSPSQYGGVCPELSFLLEEEKCNTPNCPVNCTVSPWSSWGNCPVSCGGGFQHKSRSVISPSQYGGVCPELSFLSEEEKCNTQVCPVDCAWSPWQSWNTCSSSCGGGKQLRMRTKNSFTGKDCQGPMSEEESCNTTPCTTIISISPTSIYNGSPTSMKVVFSNTLLVLPSITTSSTNGSITGATFSGTQVTFNWTPTIVGTVTFLFSNVTGTSNTLISSNITVLSSYYNISPPISGLSVYTPAMGVLNIGSAGQYYLTPSNNMKLTFEMWGASGGSGPFVSGAGGYAIGTINLLGGNTYVVIVGEKGYIKTSSSSKTSLGGGGPVPGSDGNHSSGGGLSGVFIANYTQGNALIIAGGGGGGDYWGNGGAGGGFNAETTGKNISGGSQTSGGKGGENNGSALQGGSSSSGRAGGGGGGYYGGSSGSGNYGGSGGSGYISPTVINGSTIGGSGSTPGNAGSPNRNGSGQNTNIMADGTDGRVLISFS